MRKTKVVLDTNILVYGINEESIYPNRKSIGIFQRLIKKYKPVGNRVFDIEIVSVMLSKRIKKLFTFNVRDFEGIEEIELIDE